MKYYIPFTLRGKEIEVTVEYSAMTSAAESGFSALNLPFDPEMCVDYPMAHAYFALGYPAELLMHLVIIWMAMRNLFGPPMHIW